MKIDVYPAVDPELISDLDAGQTIWRAAHGDGSENRINEDAVMETATHSISLGLLTAFFLWIRKRFKNRGKTSEDLRAEREAVRINRTCDAMEEMLSEYFRSAQNGCVEETALSELIETTETMLSYDRDGKLAIRNREKLIGLRKSIEAYTDAIEKRERAPAHSEREEDGTDEFRRIRDLLIRQKETLFGVF